MRNKILDLPSAHHVIGDLRTHWVLFNFSSLLTEELMMMWQAKMFIRLVYL
jgi:hypothetical protein